jgi:PIN domain nuclease of toxin-antitoxin system
LGSRPLTGAQVASAISVFEIVTFERRGRLAFKIPVTEWLAHLRKLPELTIHPHHG